MSPDQGLELYSCRQLFERYPSSASLRPAVELIEKTVRSEPGIAFTHCRGLLETVCVTILADRGVEIPENPKPNWLMSQVVQLLELTTLSPDDRQAELGVAAVLRGLNSLVDGVVGLRKSQGVGPHGRDALENNVLSAEYAVLTAIAVDAAVGLLFRLHEEQIGRDPVNHLRFGTHNDFDEYLDRKYELEIEEAPIRASQALHHQDRGAYRKSLVEFRNRSEGEHEEIGEGEAVAGDSDE